MSMNSPCKGWKLSRNMGEEQTKTAVNEALQNNLPLGGLKILPAQSVEAYV